MDHQGENLPQPQTSETLPSAPAPAEQAPVPHSPEKTPSRAPETAGKQINQQPASPAAAAPITLPPVVVPPASPTNDDAAASIGSTPAVADDVDVIEKEWVDKAKQIVNETKGDPYRQEQSVEELQRSYLKKRYNKELGKS